VNAAPVKFLLDPPWMFSTSAAASGSGAVVPGTKRAAAPGEGDAVATGAMAGERALTAALAAAARWGDVLMPSPAKLV
jgi:hypothetical protein